MSARRRRTLHRLLHRVDIATTDIPQNDGITLPGGLRLALRRTHGAARPFLLVHGLASNARLWDCVARRLAAAGHEVVAVDLRGHGRSEQAPDGYTTSRCAANLAVLITELGFLGKRAPVVAGQSWGGNVVLTLAAEHGGVSALALVDGGWIWLRQRYETFEQCWAELAPPLLTKVSMTELGQHLQRRLPGFSPEAIDAQLANFKPGGDGFAKARLTRERHKQILHSLWADDPRPLFAKVTVPTLLAVALAAEGDDRPGPDMAAAGISTSAMSVYIGAHHDLHAQHPDRLMPNTRPSCNRTAASCGPSGGAAAMSRLVVMASGETPTMVRLHRDIFATCPAGPAVMLDTPFAFQANRAELVTRIRAYFAQSVGRDIEVAPWADADPAQQERSLALLDRATWVFAGPGSPTYALRKWRGTGVLPDDVGVLGVDEHTKSPRLTSSRCRGEAGAWPTPSNVRIRRERGPGGRSGPLASPTAVTTTPSSGPSTSGKKTSRSCRRRGSTS